MCMTEKGKHVNYQRIGQLDKNVFIVTDKRDQGVIRKVSIYSCYVMKLSFIVTDKRDQGVIRKVSIYSSYVMKLSF